MARILGKSRCGSMICSFPQVFLMHFLDLKQKNGPRKFVPKFYGFKIYGMTGSKFEGQVKKSKAVTKLGTEG